MIGLEGVEESQQERRQGQQRVDADPQPLERDVGNHHQQDATQQDQLRVKEGQAVQVAEVHRGSILFLSSLSGNAALKTFTAPPGSEARLRLPIS